MIEEIFKDIDSRMQKTINALTHELSTIRTGRANPSIVEHIKADYHGVPTPLNQMASISIPESKMIVIQPWDKTMLRNIEKAILKSDIGLNPMNDGNVIRIAIPPITEDRRKELIKLVHKRLEDTKIALRNIRRDGLESLRKAEREKEISQDELTRTSDKLQLLIDAYIEKADKVSNNKETEILEI